MSTVRKTFAIPLHNRQADCYKAFILFLTYQYLRCAQNEASCAVYKKTTAVLRFSYYLNCRQLPKLQKGRNQRTLFTTRCLRSIKKRVNYDYCRLSALFWSRVVRGFVETLGRLRQFKDPDPPPHHSIYQQFQERWRHMVSILEAVELTIVKLFSKLQNFISYLDFVRKGAYAS